MNKLNVASFTRLVACVVLLNGVTACGGRAAGETPEDAGVADAGTVCSLGDAQAPPSSIEVVVTDAVRPSALAIGGDEIYWADGDGVIQAVPLTGGAVATLASHVAGPDALALGAPQLFAAAVGTCAGPPPCPGSILAIPLAGGAVSTVVSPLAGVADVAVDAHNLYWLGGDVQPYATCFAGECTGAVLQAPRGGGAVATLYSGTHVAGSLAVDSSSVYWTDTVAGTVMKAPIGGGASVTLASASDRNVFPRSVAVDGTSVYWTTTSASGMVPIGPVGSGTVMKAPLAGGKPVTLASGQPSPTSLRVDGGNLYWVNPTDGTLVRQSVCGGSPVTLAAGQSQLGSCVIGPDAAFCIRGDTIVRIAPK